MFLVLSESKMSREARGVKLSQYALKVVCISQYFYLFMQFLLRNKFSASILSVILKGIIFVNT